MILRNYKYPFVLLQGVLSCCVAGLIQADPVDERHGAVHEDITRAVDFEGGITVTAQHANDNAVDDVELPIDFPLII